MESFMYTMCGFHKVITLFTWILFLQGRVEVLAYYNDGSNSLLTVGDVWHQRTVRLATPTNEELACERPQVYECEEPPNIVPPEYTKTCNYRNQRFHEQIYRWVAGRGCLLYTPDFLYVAGTNTINLNANCLYGNLFAPCLEIAKEDGTCGCYPFDPGLEVVVQAVQEALLPSAHGRWERCFYEAYNCCSQYMLGRESNQCEATFDGWTCWQPAKGGSVATEVCSEFAYSGQGPSCHHFSSKECFDNGTWALQTDYSSCSITQRLLRRYRFYIAVLSFSIASCLPAVFVFFFYKRLRITRVALHRNLLIVIIVRNILVIVSRSAIYIDELTNSGETVMSTHGIACRTLAVAERVAANAVFVCMLVEGIYLHRLIVAVFRHKLNVNMLYGIGAVVAVVPVAAWAAVMGVHNDHSCWLVYTVPNIQWILDAPRVAVLLLNTVLFVDVLRVLLTKIRNSENSNQLNTTKASLFLMPIFGCQFLLTAFRPDTNNCTGEQIYYIVSYTVEGLQGFTVAMMYCYVNKEVHTLVKATYKKTENAVVSRVRRDSTYPRSSFSQDRRMTYSTGLPSNNDVIKDEYAGATPKLHVAEIVSIQASERLAEILDPTYETIKTDVVNEKYDYIDRSDADNDSGFIANKTRKGEDYYGFTNVSSVSMDGQDWNKCLSNDNVYENYPNDNDTICAERRFKELPKSREQNIRNFPTTKQQCDYNNLQIFENDISDSTEYANGQSEYEDCDTMFEEIMQYIESDDHKHEVILDPSLLSPNRNENDKIIFVDDINS